MTVAGLTIVKNEEDIIESFIRYNLKILDYIVLIDNGSSDGTVAITEALQSEGYKIYLFYDAGEFNQIRMTNAALLKMTSGEIGTVPDFIVPLDSDEFIVSTEIFINPRQIIELLSPAQIHKIRWITFIPESDTVEYEFIPYLMTLSRSDDYEEVEKLIVPTTLIKEGFVLNNGNHDAFAPYEIEKISCNQLRIAHFPIRSKSQFVFKNTIGYFNRLATKTYIKGRSRHIENAYYAIKNQKQPILDLMKYYAINYCEENVPECAVQNRDSLFAWCDVILLQYYLLRKNNSRELFLSDLEAIVERCRASFSESPNLCLEPHDIQASLAIEQYSFKKMRVERLKRDYYKNQSRFLWVCLMLEKRGINCGELISELVTEKTLIYGSMLVSGEYLTKKEVYIVDCGVESYGDNGSIIYQFENVPWNSIKQAVICDPTRIEEISSILISKGVNKIINVIDWLKKKVEDIS